MKFLDRARIVNGAGPAGEISVVCTSLGALPRWENRTRESKGLGVGCLFIVLFLAQGVGQWWGDG